MKVITAKEYTKNYNQLPEEAYMNNYVKSLIKNSKTSDMVEFYNPWFLAGPFSGKFGLLQVDNYLNRENIKLKTQAEDYEGYANTRVNNHTLANILKPKSTVFEYISGVYSNKSGAPQTKDEYGKYCHRFFTKKPDTRILTNYHPYLENHICSSDSVSAKDILVSVKEALNSHSKEEVIKAIDDSLFKADKELEDYFNEERNAYPTYELPFRVHLTGNDDASWSMCYSTEEEAMEVRKEIIKNPTKGTIDKYLVFTN